jgi:hypothetical protein
MSVDPSAPTVVFIMGSGRSGTTLLGSILGEQTGAFNAGELSYLWERGILEPRGCGCGRDPLECPVWAPVIQQISDGGDARALAQRMVALRPAMRLRNTRRILRGAQLSKVQAQHGLPLPRSFDDTVATYGGALTAVYRALSETTGAKVIIDTSKHPPDAALVGRLTGIRPYFVQLVRDPRAVAHSWRRRKEGIARRKVPLAAADWLITNAAADAVRARHRSSSLLIRYEDLMDEPAGHVAAATELAGISAAHNPFIDERTVALSPNHTVSGNPDRFTAGPTALHRDDRWQRDMPIPVRAAVTAIAWPGMVRYRYPRRP